MSHYHNNDSGDLAFAVTILLICSLWTHKAFMQQVEHYAKLSGLVAIAIMAILMLIRLYRKGSKWKRGRIPSMKIIDTMTGLEFELYVAKILKTNGFTNVRLTEEYDYGIDIIATKNGTTWGIQVKRYSGLVGANAVRQVVTALRIYQCDKAMVITNSTFSRTAVALADANDCVLVNGSKLNINTYVQEQSHYL